MSEKLDLLISRHRKGTTLPQEFYGDQQIYQRDIERIHLRHWLCVGALLPGFQFRNL